MLKRKVKLKNKRIHKEQLNQRKTKKDQNQKCKRILVKTKKMQRKINKILPKKNMESNKR